MSSSKAKNGQTFMEIWENKSDSFDKLRTEIRPAGDVICNISLRAAPRRRRKSCRVVFAQVHEDRVLSAEGCEKEEVSDVGVALRMSGNNALLLDTRKRV